MSPEAEAKPMGETGRLVNVFLDPKAAFADIAVRPRPWVPLAIVIAIAMVFLACFSQRVGWERYLRQKAETTPQFQELPSEQRERAIQMQLKFVPYASYAGPVVGFTGIVVIVAGAVLLMVKLMGGMVAFKQMFSITAYAFLPGALERLAAIGVLFLKSPDDFDLENPTVLNLGAILDPTTSAKWVISLASSVDVFAIWTAILIAVGITVTAKRTSFGKALTAVVTPWILWIVLKVGWAAIRG
ncbi:MAG: YIP1 family protein [Bryobacterales bacterium]|nr:YIP1 family protein [Bryobacterales bacterium]